MRRSLLVLVPIGAVAVVGGGLLTWSWYGARPCQEYVTVDFFELDPSTRCVQVRGNAHYEVVLNATIAGNGFFEDQTWFLFGLFPPKNTEEREIRVLVRTQRPPERLVSYEEMVVSGRLLPMDYRKIPADAETVIAERSGYYFRDRVFLLEPDRIEVHGEPDWVRAE